MKQFDMGIGKIDFNVFTKYLVGDLIDFLNINGNVMKDSLLHFKTYRY